METNIQLKDLLCMTIGQLAALTNEFIAQNPEIETAQQKLEEHAKKSA